MKNRPNRPEQRRSIIPLPRSLWGALPKATRAMLPQKPNRGGGVRASRTGWHDGKPTAVPMPRKKARNRARRKMRRATQQAQRR